MQENGEEELILSWAGFSDREPALAEAGRGLLYHFGVGLAFLATTTRDGAPRVHPICPVIAGDGLYGLIVPSPKLGDLIRDGRFALHSYPLESNEDAFYITGRAGVPASDVRAMVEDIFLQERPSLDQSAPKLHEQTLVEFYVETVLLTRTTGHGDPAPRHTVWKSTP